MAENVLIVVDDQDVATGQKIRGTMNEKIHRGTCLWLTNSHNQVLIVQRKMTKASNPGKWGPSVAGTVELGETYDSNIYKEAEEEIGLTGLKFEVGPKKYIDNGKYRYFAQWYFAPLDREESEFTLQDTEVEQVKWINKSDLLQDLAAHPENYTSSAPNTWPDLLS